MSGNTFNLLSEPWIPVRPLGAPGVQLVGIREALEQAREFTGIEDTSPLQTAALYRLLLAVLHRALMGPKDSRDVVTWWNDGFPEGALKTYLQTHTPRFELFGEQPFLQVADLPLEGFKQSWERLGAEVGGGNTTLLFNATRRIGHLPPALDPASAARRLLEHQTFALGGLTKKFTTSALGAPSATSAMILARGGTLHETLCLNLVPYTQGIQDDLPPWELPEPMTVQTIQGFYPGKEKLAQPVRGVAQGYAWQGRSVRLEREDDGRVRFLAYAEGVPPNLTAGWRDPMVALRTLKDGTLYPMKLSPERLFWRDFEAVMPTHARETYINAQEKARISLGSPPLVLEHATDLYRRLGRGGTPIPLMVFGQINDQGKIEMWRSERYELPTAAQDDNVYQFIPEALDLAKDTRDALNHAVRGLASKLLSAGGRDAHKDDVSKLARSLGAEQLYWSSLEDPFRAFLNTLGGDADAALNSWDRALAKVAQAAWDVAKQSAGDDARAMRAKYESEGYLMKHLNTLRKGA
ncbi:type I-E CRISPR-associated protein Cse1/CasA [Deinococcus ruber]|uniref:CRISPR-associated protein CasA/Cse1 n=1 Tax=Deinococcus ruber TaxID=1848197 RepID=A0A918C805_9DEIO|nr:type I-E CRISPR-associated protein Cse1/CasA [Deinococcus ruber]GGR11475.1 CRISPR-associated protein CasA/Cse1 [Deinococcus ruber]